VSYRIVADVFDSGLLEGGKLLVMLALGEWSNEEGFCFPGEKKICFRTRQSPRNTRRCFNDLIKLGAIKKGTDGFRDGFWINVTMFREAAQKELDAQPKTLWNPENLALLTPKSRAANGQKRADDGTFSTVDVRPAPTVAADKMSAKRTTAAPQTDICGTDSGHLRQRNKEEPPLTTRNRQEPPAARDDSPPPRGPDPAPVPVILFPLNDHTDYGVMAEEVLEWCGLYPAIDVRQQLRNMRGWLLSHPQNRKTRNGIPRFVTAWLAKEQNSAGRTSNHEHSPDTPRRTSYGSERQERNTDVINHVFQRDGIRHDPAGNRSAPSNGNGRGGAVLEGHALAVSGPSHPVGVSGVPPNRQVFPKASGHR
jgi:hypothetical protein